MARYGRSFRDRAPGGLRGSGIDLAETGGGGDFDAYGVPRNYGRDDVPARGGARDDPPHPMWSPGTVRPRGGTRGRGFAREPRQARGWGYGEDFRPLRPDDALARAVRGDVRDTLTDIARDVRPYGGRYTEDAGGEFGGGVYGERVRDVMTADPETVAPDDTLADAARKMRELDVGILPVVEGPESRRLHGVITDRDITVRAVAEGRGSETRVAECMSRDVDTVREGDFVRDVLDVMGAERVRRVPVLDDDDELVGIVAQADLVVGFAGDAPERSRRVERAIDRISQPGRPRR